MSIINRIRDEIVKFKSKHNQRPHLILIGLKEKDELWAELFPNFKKLPNRFYGARVIYTEKESEVTTLMHELKQ